MVKDRMAVDKDVTWTVAFHEAKAELMKDLEGDKEGSESSI